MITKFCLKAKFAGIENEIFFEVDEQEFLRLKERFLAVSRPDEAISFRMSDGSAAIVVCKSVETLHFVFESSLEEFPPLEGVKDSDCVVKYRLLGRGGPEYLAVESPLAAVEFYERVKEALETDFAEDAGLFFSANDEEGRDFYFNRDSLLYVVVPKRVYEDGSRQLRGKKA